MKLNLTENLRTHSAVGNIVLAGLTKASLEMGVNLTEFAEEYRVGKDIMVDIDLTIGGVKIDIEHLIERWQSQIKKEITTKANEIVDNRMADVTDLMDDLRTRLADEVNSRLEDWEDSITKTYKEEK